MRLLIAGGGSGGHVFPGLAVAEVLRRLAPTVHVEWLGAREGIETRLVPAHMRLHTIHAGKLNRFLGKETLRDLMRVPVGLLEASAFVRHFRPDVILTCGGFVAVPAGVAGALAGRPLIALQQDVAPNLANRLIAPVARRVVVAFAASVGAFAPGKALALGNPLRESVMHGDAATGRRLFRVPDGVPLVLVTGGSQGALDLNRMVLAALPRWLQAAAVVHLCGDRSLDLVGQAAAALPADLARRYAWRTFVDSAMPHLLAAADLVVCRAGAGTLAELAALGKASVLVPLPPPMGKSPQEINAAAFARAGAAVVLDQRQATADTVVSTVEALLGDQGRRQRLGAAAAALGRPQAAQDVARLVLAAGSPAAAAPS